MAPQQYVRKCKACGQYSNWRVLLGKYWEVTGAVCGTCGQGYGSAEHVKEVITKPLTWKLRLEKMINKYSLGSGVVLVVLGIGMLGLHMIPPQSAPPLPADWPSTAVMSGADFDHTPTNTPTVEIHGGHATLRNITNNESGGLDCVLVVELNSRQYVMILTALGSERAKSSGYIPNVDAEETPTVDWQPLLQSFNAGDRQASRQLVYAALEFVKDQQANTDT